MPTIVTVGTASAKGFGWSSGAPKINYYIISFSNSPNTSLYNSLGYDPVAADVYLGLNLNTSPLNYTFARMKLSDFSVSYTENILSVNPTLGTPYFIQPTYNPANAGITFGLYPNSIIIYGSITTANPPVYNWVKKYELALSSYNTLDSNAQAIDGSGNHYIAGTYRGYSTICCCVEVTSYAPYIMKTNSSGVVQWAFYAGFGYSSYCKMAGVKVSSAGNIYVVYTNTIADAPTGGKLVKYNSSGTIQWTVLFQSGGLAWYPGGSTLQNNSIGLDSSENVYIAGYFYSGSATGTLIKYNSSGTLQWARKYVPVSPSTAAYMCVALSASGDIYLFGYGYPYASTGSLYVLKYNSSGVIQWQRYLTTNNSSYGSNISLNTGAPFIANDGSVLFSIYGIDTGSSYTAGGYSMVFKMPANGTGTGSYTLQSCVYTYSSASGTDSDYTSSITSTSSSHGSAAASVTTTTNTGTFSTFSTTNQLVPVV